MRRDVKFNEEKALRCPLEQELSIPLDQEIQAPNEEPLDELQEVMEQPHVEDLGVETSTTAESSKYWRKCTREADRLLQDARENVGAPTSQRK